MRILLTLMWRLLARLVRRLGFAALLVPVAALGMAVFGVTLWTIAAVGLAVVMTVRRPAAAAALLPVAMVCGDMRTGGGSGRARNGQQLGRPGLRNHRAAPRQGGSPW